MKVGDNKWTNYQITYVNDSIEEQEAIARDFKQATS